MPRTRNRFPRPSRRPPQPGRPRVEALEDRALPSFVTAPTFPTNPNPGVRTAPVAVATGDFNGDGKLDVVTANSGSNEVALLRGTGFGTFYPALDFKVGNDPVALVTGDFNGDGKLDVAVANKGDNTVTVLLGRGNGTFLAPLTFAAGPKPIALAVGDFNGDGHLDLAVVDGGSPAGVTLLLGDGTGHFTAGGTLTAGSSPTAVAVGDFNGDGKPDLAVVGGGFDHLDVFLNQGDGTFAAPVNYATGFNANALVVGDFNHDHVTDVAVACAFPSKGVSVLLGNGDGTFQTFTQYDVGQDPATLAVADLNGDGVPDLVTANDQFGNNNVSAILGNGDGTFGPAFTVLTAGQQPVAVATGDFNGDGLTDAVVADESSQAPGVSLLLGNGDGTFVAPRNLAVASPGPVVVGDFNGDHVPDLAVVTNGTYKGVEISGLGHGAFGAPVQAVADLGTTIYGLAVADFNHDNVPDLAVATDNGVTVFDGNGDGTFGPGQTYAAGTSPKWVTAADLNGDGFPDLVVADGDGSGGVSVLLNDGTGTFGAATPVATGGKAAYVTTADLNGDHKQDLVVVDNADSKVSVLLGNGDGTFAAPVSFSTDGSPNSVAVGDFNGDGKPDLAVTTFFGPGVQVFFNIGHGAFRAGARYAVGSLPIGIVAADLNGDGHLDLATADDFHDTVTVWMGYGNGAFAGPLTYTVGDGPKWLAAADLNGDGQLDLAVANSNANSVTLLSSTAPAAHFRVLTSAPSLTAGGAVRVTVEAFDADNNLLPNYTGVVRLSSSDHIASLPPYLVFTAANHGMVAFGAYLRTAGSDTITAQAGPAAGSVAVTVVPAAATHLLLTTDAGLTAGTPCRLTLTAYDAFGNVASGYTGTVRFTNTGPAGLTSLPANCTFTPADAGRHDFSATLDWAGVQVLRALDLASPTVWAKTTVTVAPGALSQFLLTGFPPTWPAGVAHAVFITAVDAYGNRLTGYRGTILFSSSDAGAVLPKPYLFTAQDAGQHLFAVTLKDAGTGQWISVQDQGDASLSGTVDGITIK